MARTDLLVSSPSSRLGAKQTIFNLWPTVMPDLFCALYIILLIANPLTYGVFMNSHILNIFWTLCAWLFLFGGRRRTFGSGSVGLENPASSHRDQAVHLS